jgi:hypothetical protein
MAGPRSYRFSLWRDAAAVMHIRMGCAFFDFAQLSEASMIGGWCPACRFTKRRTERACLAET